MLGVDNELREPSGDSDELIEREWSNKAAPGESCSSGD